MRKSLIKFDKNINIKKKKKLHDVKKKEYLETQRLLEFELNTKNQNIVKIENCSGIIYFIVFLKQT